MKYSLLALSVLSLCLSQTLFAQMNCQIKNYTKWDGGFTLDNIRVTNVGPVAVNQWQVYVTFNKNINIINSWNADLANSNDYQFKAASKSYNGTLASGESVAFGLQGEAEDFKLSDVRCSAVAQASFSQNRSEFSPENQLFNIPGRIQAENYSQAFDSTPENLGGAYRKTEAVDIQATTDTGGGMNVGWVGHGEWLKYPIQVKDTGVYQIKLRVAAYNRRGQIKVYLDDRVIQRGLIHENTGGWQNWTDAAFNAQITEGIHTLKIEFLNPGVNLNYIDVTRQADIQLDEASPESSGINPAIIELLQSGMSSPKPQKPTDGE